ncbi:hypothetical protein BDQ17DRAFT_1387602 [Cyathus striatus]|nr:hypothetical protein BDQ17DRAFT_1387602 [Cyathus striatus]
MTRRSLSASPSPREAKRQRIDHLTKEDFKNGVFLAPMVRSGALPSRLMALKYGATLVWGPEIVDKAILHAKREVDRNTFTAIGSSDPEIAVQAAKMVMNDVSGIDLNCGCPKPFSTHSGMGAALLTNPDLLCSILTALRAALPSEITVSAKIRLLPSQEDTLKLVERIVNTGISCLTVHCRTRTMREKDKAVIERLREIVEFVDKMGKGIAVVENGDCLNWEGARRVRNVTGASSVMIARGAESNLSCFSSTPLTDVEKTLMPSYLRLCKYLDNHHSLTKFCVMQFKAPRINVTKDESTVLRSVISRAKRYEDLTSVVDEWTGEQEMQEIMKAIQERDPRSHRMILSTTPESATETRKNWNQKVRHDCDSRRHSES